LIKDSGALTAISAPHADDRYARASDEACALIREALVTSGDIIPGDGQLLIGLDPLTSPRGSPRPRPRPAARHQADLALSGQAHQGAA
jgi:hypothetical protein